MPILDYRSERVLAVFGLRVTLVLPTKIQVSWPYGSREEAKIYVTPMLTTKYQVNWPYSSVEEAKIDFKDGGHVGHLGFLIGTILFYFIFFFFFFFFFFFMYKSSRCFLPSFKLVSLSVQNRSKN